MKLATVLLAGFLLSATSWGKVEGASLPAGFVYLKQIDSSIVQDMRYASTNNFVGRKLPGYQANECILARPVALALKRVQRFLQTKGMTLIVLDCYRPQRAVRGMLNYIKNKQGNDPKYYPKIAAQQLVARGYIAARSSHSSGGTVDLTFGWMKSGRLVPADMGTVFDHFGSASHTNSKKITKKARNNRRVLVKAMHNHGFKNYRREWWHFSYRNNPYRGRYFDFPIESAE